MSSTQRLTRPELTTAFTVLQQSIDILQDQPASVLASSRVLCEDGPPISVAAALDRLIRQMDRLQDAVLNECAKHANVAVTKQTLIASESESL